MPRKRHKPEEIVAKLRQVDVLVSQGQSVADAIRSISVTKVTYDRWRQEYGGLKTDQVRRLKELDGLPPEKWSSLRYGFAPAGGRDDGKEEAHRRRDRRQTAAG